MPVLFGLAALLVLIFGARAFAQAEPRRLARLVRRMGGVALLGLAGFLLLRGAWEVALPIGLFALSLFGAGPFARSRARSRPSPGRRSQARSAFLEMSLDHDSGATDGRVLKGRFAGAALWELDPDRLRALHSELRADPGSLRLLEAYLDGRLSGWREDFERDAAAGQHGPARPGAMTEEEAYGALGLRPGASEGEIRRAHRTLMKRAHPDRGGSTSQAARINEAKDRLLQKHRRDL